jgi:ribosomal protein S27E
MAASPESRDLRIHCPDCARTLLVAAERLRLVPTVKCLGCGRDLTIKAQELARNPDPRRV